MNSIDYHETLNCAISLDLIDRLIVSTARELIGKDEWSLECLIRDLAMDLKECIKHIDNVDPDLQSLCDRYEEPVDYRIMELEDENGELCKIIESLEKAVSNFEVRVDELSINFDDERELNKSMKNKIEQLEKDLALARATANPFRLA